MDRNRYIAGTNNRPVYNIIWGDENSKWKLQKNGEDKEINEVTNLLNKIDEKNHSFTPDEIQQIEKMITKSEYNLWHNPKVFWCKAFWYYTFRAFISGGKNGDMAFEGIEKSSRGFIPENYGTAIGFSIASAYGAFLGVKEWLKGKKETDYGYKRSKDLELFSNPSQNPHESTLTATASVTQTSENSSDSEKYSSIDL